MAEVLPEIVGYDAEGNPAGVQYGQVSALLVEAMKEQQVEIDSLRTENEELRQDLDALVLHLQSLGLVFE